MKKLLIGLVGLCACTGFADSFYADATNGNDEWNGLFAVSNGVDETTGLVNGPKQTLAAAMALVPSTSQHVVYAAEGNYSNGVDYAEATTSYAAPARVCVRSNAKLIATGSRVKTVIWGEKDVTSGNVGPTALRGVVLRNGASIFGFTIRRCAAPTGGRGGGVLFLGQSTAVDCYVTDCVADRGGAGNCENGGATGSYPGAKGSFVNCVLSGCSSINPGASIYAADCFNTLIANSSSVAPAMRAGWAINCTICTQIQSVRGYNCVCTYATDNGSCVMTNCYAASHSASSVWDNETFKQSAIAYDETLGMPSGASNPIIGSGNEDYFTNWFPAVAKDYMDKDAWGSPRRPNGVLDSGAVAVSTARYVDAVNGDDANCGLSTNAAKRTLAEVAKIATSGDVIHAAPGIYNEGVSGVMGVTTNRVIVPKGVGLVADQGPDVTIIEGKQNDKGGYAGTTNLIRCCYLREGAYIKGFTLRKGAAVKSGDYGNCGGGIEAESSNTAAIGCVFTNNAALRGTSASTVWAIGCLFYGSGSAPANGDLYAGYAVNSVFVNGASAYCQNRTLLNCTVYSPGAVWGGGSNSHVYVYNSILPGDGGSGYATYSNCVFESTWIRSTSEAIDCKLGRTDAFSSLDDSYRSLPVTNSVIVDAGSDSVYDNQFPAAFAAVAAGYDFAGGARKVGASIDIGAGECDWRNLPASSGVTVTLEEGETETTVTIACNYQGKVPVEGIIFNGTEVSFTGDTDSYTTKLANEAVASAKLEIKSPKSITAWYVDQATGDDSNKGYRPKVAFKTINKALAAAGDDQIIYVGPGTYSEVGGVNTDGNGRTQTNVLYVTQRNLGIVATGSRDETIIEGVVSKDQTARRCVYFLYGTSYIRGFTLRNGGTYGNEDAGVYYGAGIDNGMAIDCRITGCDCNSARGGAAAGAKLIRCVVEADNHAMTGNGGNNGSYFGCVMKANTYTWGSDAAHVVNCLYIGCGPQGNTDSINVYNSVIYSDSADRCNYHRCVLTGKLAANDTTPEDDVVVKASAASYAYDATTYRPLAGSLAIDAGDDAAFAAKFPSAYQDKDVMGGTRILGSAIDLGPGEFNWQALPTTSGLTLTIEKGATESTVTFARNFESELLCSGFTFNGQAYDFSTTASHVLPVSTASLDTSTLTIQYEPAGNWYVNPAGDDSAKGYHKDCPVKTLAAAMALAKSEHIVHAAPGVYNEGAMAPTSWEYGSNRVTVLNKVVLVSDEGPDVTVIEGKISTAEGATAYGCGPDSLRAVQVGEGAVIKGFTIRNGRTATTMGTSKQGNSDGGGVLGVEGLIVDCVISNCAAWNRGNLAENGSYLRCRFGEQTVGANGWAVYSQAKLVNCVALSSGTAYSAMEAWNCLFGNNCYPEGTSAAQVRANNCVFSKCYAGKYCNLYNCYATGGMGAGSVDKEANQLNLGASALPFDAETARPLAGSPVIDKAGDYTDRMFDVITNRSYRTRHWGPYLAEQLDFAKGQRVYNGAMDVGPGEYDYRPTFGKALKMRNVAVDAATANVQLDAKTLKLADGDSVTATWTIAKADLCTFKVVVTGEGTATVTVDGVAVTPDAEGICRFTGAIGESVVVVSFEGDGYANVSTFKGPYGTVILFN